jgi:hypothetical protein
LTRVPTSGEDPMPPPLDPSRGTTRGSSHRGLLMHDPRVGPLQPVHALPRRPQASVKKTIPNMVFLLEKLYRLAGEPGRLNEKVQFLGSVGGGKPVSFATGPDR